MHFLNFFFFFLLYGCFLSALISFEETLGIVTATYFLPDQFGHPVCFSRTLKHLVKRISKGSYPQLLIKPDCLITAGDGGRRKFCSFGSLTYWRTAQKMAINVYRMHICSVGTKGHFYISIWFLLHFPAKQLDMHSIKQQPGRKPEFIIIYNVHAPHLLCVFFPPLHILHPDAAADQRTRSPAVAALRGSLGRTVKLNDSASSAWHMLVFVAVGWKSVSWHRQDSLSGRHTINMQ